MNEEVQSIPYYDSFDRKIRRMNKNEIAAFAFALGDYAFRGIKPDFDRRYGLNEAEAGRLWLAWEGVTNSIDKAIKNQANGKKGGRKRNTNPLGNIEILV
jgi:hypothetical protein